MPAGPYAGDERRANVFFICVGGVYVPGSDYLPWCSGFTSRIQPTSAALGYRLFEKFDRRSFSCEHTFNTTHGYDLYGINQHLDPFVGPKRFGLLFRLLWVFRQ